MSETKSARSRCVAYERRAGAARLVKSLHVEPGRIRMMVVTPMGDAKLAATYTDTSMKGTFAARRGTRPFQGRRKAD
ncbi:MAG: hypothetical protein AAGF11_32615 [Myxococcota bacterium]